MRNVQVKTLKRKDVYHRSETLANILKEIKITESESEVEEKNLYDDEMAEDDAVEQKLCVISFIDELQSISKYNFINNSAYLSFSNYKYSE